jgi:hypothetical protein
MIFGHSLKFFIPERNHNNERRRNLMRITTIILQYADRLFMLANVGLAKSLMVILFKQDEGLFHRSHLQPECILYYDLRPQYSDDGFEILICR